MSAMRLGQSPRASGASRGFTLIEVLVVLAIIVVICAILFPVLSRARAAARKTTCASNLHQIGLALTMYSDDHDALGPPTTGWHIWGGNGTNGDYPGPGWEERIDPYVKNRAVYRCPAAPGVVQFAYFLNTRFFWLVKGMPQVQWGCAAVNHAYLSAPSYYVMAGDCSSPNLLPPPVGSAPLPEDSCDKDNMTYQCLRYHGTFHGNGSNVLFADGHAKFFTGYNHDVMTFEPTSMSDWQ